MLCRELARIVILWLSFFLGTTKGEKIWNGSSSITAVQGETITMAWMVNLTSIDSNKIWTYAKIIQVQEGRTTELMSLQKSGIKIIEDQRYQSRESDLNLNTSQTGATVTIKFTMKHLVRLTDEKHYKAMLGFSSDSSTFPGATSLLILEKPHSTTITASPNQTSYCFNDSITVTCVSSAYPNANYNLYRNNRLVQKGSSSGVFSVSTGVTDRVFTCVPYNTVGSGQNRSFQVYVKEPPKIHWCKINEATTTNSTVVEGSKVSMICQISGSEPMNVTWIRLNALPPLRWNERNLTFSAISREEGGWYRMYVNNGEECKTTANATLRVNVNYKPFGTSISVLPNQSSFCIKDLITITCKTEAKPSPKYSLYQNNQLIQKPSKSRLYIMFLLVKGEIVLDCVPSNAVGIGQRQSLRIFVKEPPSISTCKVNNFDQTNVTVNEGTKVNINCEFSGTRPLNVTWTKESQANVHWNQWNLTLHSIHRNDHGIYRVSVYNGKECNTAVSKTFHLVVNYISKLQVVGNNFNVFNKSTALVNFEILTDAYPDVTLTCQSAQLKEELIFVQRNKKESTKTQFIVTANTTNIDSNIRLKCTAENEVDSRTTGFLIYKQGVAKIVSGSMKLVDQDWISDLSNVNSEAHKKLRGKCMKMLYDVYNDIPYVQKWNVLRFTPGSVVLYFQLHVIAEVSDPLLPLRIAVDRNGGFVNNLQIDPTSIQKTDDVQGYKQSQTTISTEGIIAALTVVIALSVMINIILFVLLFRAKAASKTKNRHDYDDPNLVSNDNDNHHQDEIPLQRRPLPAAPNDNDDHHQDTGIALEDSDDYHKIDDIQEISHSQPQTNIERSNPILNQSLPEINENQDQTQNISSTSTDETNNQADDKIQPQRTNCEVPKPSIEKEDERRSEEDAANEPLKPPVPKVGAKSSKEYSLLDPSTKLPPKDNRPGLEQTHAIQISYFDNFKHKYQNQETTGETLGPVLGNKTEQLNDSSKGYNRLIRPTTLTPKDSRPVSEHPYEIQPIPSVDKNQKRTQSPCNSQDNKGFAVDERQPQKTCGDLKSTVDNKTDHEPQNESFEELQSFGSINETTA
ncbi:uncharacterized protein LOC116305473 isoform X3 [Actinia tenebrosa]|uniref:Uncharacterized protein LOC116305473 isoform X3 n=1 Tax=Actinia tenebrosa TaxID=6105 RepID=A0A6P8IW54_ACTTE|nr:uncharacterized protein LOC116305473 isoform X3 [Actinia tenebrosa]